MEEEEEEEEAEEEAEAAAAAAAAAEATAAAAEEADGDVWSWSRGKTTNGRENLATGVGSWKPGCDHQARTSERLCTSSTTTRETAAQHG